MLHSCLLIFYDETYQFPNCSIEFVTYFPQLTQPLGKFHLFATTPSTLAYFLNQVNWVYKKIKYFLTNKQGYSNAEQGLFERCTQNGDLKKTY